MNFFTRNFLTVVELINIVKNHKNLIVEMARRELSDRYSGQVFGLTWAIIHPIFLMGVYFFIFSVVFKMKLGGTFDMPRDYTTYLLSGLVMWLTFQDVLSKSCTTISSNTILVKQFVFPVEILPIKTVLASMLNLVVSLGVLAGYCILKYGLPPITYLLLPVILFLQITAMIGVAYFLGAIGAYFRDMKDVFQLFALVNMYLMPIFYLPSMVPDFFKPVIFLNPFSAYAFMYQDALYYGRFEHPWSWVAAAIISPLWLLYGYRFFKRVSPMFGSAL
jgi:lipopolysaccharide transport system permease protein